MEFKQRKFEFRAWNPKNKILWYYGTNFNKDEITTQLTDFTDKNGKEIWEVDIVKSHKHIGFNGIIKFERGKFEIYYFSKEYPKIKFYSDLFSDLHHIEVIGNVFENGDLLEEWEVKL
jgi:uncharacterized phage protein (TIGR01671 family)